MFKFLVIKSIVQFIIGYFVDAMLLVCIISLMGFVFSHPAVASIDAVNIIKAQEERFYGYAHKVGNYDRVEAGALMRLQ